MAFSDVMRGIADVILNNKLITFLSVALFAFIIATIALAGQNHSNADALAECQYRLQNANPMTTIVPGESTTQAGATTTAETVTTTTTVATTSDSSPAGETSEVPTTTTEVTTSSASPVEIPNNR
ncbi:uncharacterized protein LOC128745692 [Sabethes cyaneus]|uniref:uncharacterized protein LOC128745692 n=1 Tax=Sabethes cyaneus TaxID=53552 RepID=UPI00237ECF61|nr:uncharacterized protein LOC128745692 [Sabethes cyaneus]